MGITTFGLIKHSFFSNTVTDIEPISFADKNFSLDELLTEFNTLYQLFLSNKENWSNQAEIVLYMHYVSSLLIQYYELDYVRSDLQRIHKQKEEIELYINTHFIKTDEESYANLSAFIVKQLQQHAQNYKHSLSSISELRDHISDMNSTRSRWGYSRSLAIYAIKYLQASPLSDLIQDINSLLGNQFTFVDGINFLNNSREYIAILGIILFALRFLINLILTMKHSIQAIFNEKLNPEKVFLHELEKRGFIMISDLVWSVVTLITAFNTAFDVSASAIPFIVGGFLVFDAVLFGIQWAYVYNKYSNRLSLLDDQLLIASEFEKTVIQRQLDLLRDEWEAEYAYYAINMTGACIIALSYGLSICCLSTLGLAGLTLCGMLGNALYNTSAEYKKYYQSKVALARENTNGTLLNTNNAHHKQLLVKLNKELDENYTKFTSNLSFNVGGLAFIITVAVASWPIALCLTTLYIGQQLKNNYQFQLTKHREEVDHDIYRQVPTVSC